MVTARILNPASATRTVELETHLQATLELYFRALRGRIGAWIETSGCLPVTFWMSEYDALVRLLTPLYRDALWADLEQRQLHLLTPGRFANLNIRLLDAVRRLARELAQAVTLAAADCADDILNAGLDVPSAVWQLHKQLSAGPLSDLSAHRLAVEQAAHVMSAGKQFIARGGRTSENAMLGSRRPSLCI
jgi:hypothetical protein